MKNLLKIMTITGLFCVPQVGHAMSLVKFADRLLGGAVFGATSFEANQASPHKISTATVPLATSNQQDHLLQTAIDARDLCSQVGLKKSDLSLHVAKDSWHFGTFEGEDWNIPVHSPLVQAVPVAGETAVLFNQDYFNLTETQKKAALAPELLRIKNHEYEKEIVAGTVLPMAITTAAFRLGGKGITSLLSQSSRLIRNKYGAMGIRGIDALSKSLLLPSISNVLRAEETQYEYENGKNSKQIKTMHSLWRGYPLKATAAYTRWRALEMDKQAVKVVGKDAMVEYLSQPQNESKVTYADLAYSPVPTFKERLANIGTKA